MLPENVPRGQLEAQVDWNANKAMQEVPQEKDQKEARNQYSLFFSIHEGAELGEASEKVGALYNRWSAAAEDLIVKNLCTWQNQILYWARHDAENKNSANPTSCCKTREPRGCGRIQNLCRPDEQNSHG